MPRCEKMGTFSYSTEDRLKITRAQCRKLNGSLSLPGAPLPCAPLGAEAETPSPVSITTWEGVGITPCQGQLGEDDSTFPCYQVERLTGRGRCCPSTGCEWGRAKPSPVWRPGALTAGSLLPLPPLMDTLTPCTSTNTADGLIGDFETKLNISHFLRLFLPIMY